MSRRMAFGLLLLLAALLPVRVEASRTSVWESNLPASITRTEAAAALAALAPAAAADAEAAEPPLFNLGDTVLADTADTDATHFGLSPLTLVDLNLLRGPLPRYPETRVGGFELLPPFRVGASASLSLWSRQACGFVCREVASDSRYDPWGLITTVTATVGAGDVLPTVDWESGNTLLDATILGAANNLVNLGGKFVNAWANAASGAAAVQDKVDEKAWEKGIACRGCTSFSTDMAGMLLGTAEGRFAVEATAPARRVAAEKLFGSAKGGAKPVRVPGPFDSLSSNAKGEVGKAWSREAAIARGEKIVGEEMDLIFTIDGKEVGVRPDLLTKLPGDDTYVYIEAKFSRWARYQPHQEIVIPELVKAGDTGLVAKVGGRAGSLDPGAKIRVVFQGDTWDRGPVLVGQ